MTAKTASDSQVAIAQRIKRLLNEKGKSRREMAADLRVTTETLNSWASRGSIKRDNLISFTRYVGCTTDELLTGEDSQAEVVVHTKQIMGEGIEQHHVPVPVLETSDLMTDTAMEYRDRRDRATVVDRVEKWIANPASATELYVPYLLNHKHFEADIPGTPRYGIQVSQPDHGEELHGQLVVMATDVWPARDDWCLFLRRPMFEHGLFDEKVIGTFLDLDTVDSESPALWSLHAGYYRSDGWSVPKDADAWWKHAAERKVNRSFTLQVEKTKRCEDDVEFNFSLHQWCYLGTMVFKMGWVGLDRSLAYTRLMERKTDHLRRRTRKDKSGVFWNF